MMTVIYGPRIQPRNGDGQRGGRLLKEGAPMADRIISSKTHDAHMTVRDHIADGWVASVCVVPKGESKNNQRAVKLDTFFECEDVAWKSAETLARAELNNLK